MKKAILLILTFANLLSVSLAQRVQGTIRNSNAVPSNEVIVSIRPTVAFTALMSNLIVAVQIPISVGPRPTVTITGLQPTLFAQWDLVNADQGDGFYTYGFNCVTPGGSNTASTMWAATEMDVLRINFNGATVPPFTARICHYLDGGTGTYAIFYVETNLAAVNGGILSDWGNLFYGTGAVNGAEANGNAQYSYATAPNVTLPVKFLGFNVIKKNNDAIISWQIENESSITDFYQIERSLTGSDFNTIATLLPKKNGRTTNTYDISDLNISAIRSQGIFYYRIKQVDRDGRFVYTGIRSVRLNMKGMAVGVYPNPVKTRAKVTIDLEQDATVSIIINDALGKQVSNVQKKLFKGANIQDINMASLGAGNYTMKVQTPTETMILPVVKIN